MPRTIFVNLARFNRTKSGPSEAFSEAQVEKGQRIDHHGFLLGAIGDTNAHLVMGANWQAEDLRREDRCVAWSDGATDFNPPFRVLCLDYHRSAFRRSRKQDTEATAWPRQGTPGHLAARARSARRNEQERPALPAERRRRRMRYKPCTTDLVKVKRGIRRVFKALPKHAQRGARVVRTRQRGHERRTQSQGSHRIAKQILNLGPFRKTSAQSRQEKSIVLPGQKERSQAGAGAIE